MFVYKRLDGGSHTVQPFETNASQSFVWISGSTRSDGFSINLAKQPPSNYPLADLSLGGITDGGFYSYPLFKSIQSTFYIDSSSLSSIFEYFPSSSMFVINIPSGYTGERIKPTSLTVSISGSNNIAKDDGNGKLRLNGSGSVIGNVFYMHGIAVLKRNESATTASLSTDGISIVSASRVTTNFQSTLTIYEHTVRCTINPNEFGSTLNPSAFVTGSSSSSYNQYINSGSETPYITTIGLYDDFNVLLAIAKVSKPITRQKWSDQTFIIQFDE